MLPEEFKSLARHQLLAGEVIAFPTETFYGLGIDPYQLEGRRQLEFLKGERLDKAFPLLLPNLDHLRHLAKIDERVERLTARFWPGPLTLVLPARDTALPFVAADGTIGVRISSNGLVQQFLHEIDMPITATSANPSGLPPAMRAQEVADYFGAQLWILDGGVTPGGLASTVVKLDSHLSLIRQGVIDFAEVMREFHAS